VGFFLKDSLHKWRIATKISAGFVSFS